MSETTIENKTTSDNELKSNKYNARELIGSDSEARILLDDQVYLLRITKQNKLILTK